ncbi:MAG: hypothetical protein LBV54_05845, partial [Puniceicoccales bacterium]|nr:hypothetical protein [Puniceicoccales bacterium]
MKPAFPKNSLFTVTSKKIISGVLFCFVGVLSALGGELSFRLPGTPFASEESYLFRYWESLGEVRISGISSQDNAGILSSGVKKAFDLPLHLAFNPASNYPSPLGIGFEFALFDSRLIWLDDKQVRLHLPSGQVDFLSFDKQKQTLKGQGWLGEFQQRGNQVILKASSGWVLTLSGNRLIRMRSPEGVTLEIVRKTDGTQQLLREGSALVTLSPD